jgi:hypothetical protein
MGIKTFELLTFDLSAHYAWLVWCPACDVPHTFDNRWTFNGDRERPTFGGSMLAHGGSDDHPRCHSQLTDGVWHYGADCGHIHAGQSVPAPDWDRTRFARMRPDGVVPTHAADCAKVVADRAWIEAEFDGQHPELPTAPCTCGAEPPPTDPTESDQPG